MTGFNGNEGVMYVDKSMSESLQFRNFEHQLLPELSEEDLDSIHALYPDTTSNAESLCIEIREGIGLGAQKELSGILYACITGFITRGQSWVQLYRRQRFHF
jgi:hypothetical protein